MVGTDRDAKCNVWVVDDRLDKVFRVDGVLMCFVRCTYSFHRVVYGVQAVVVPTNRVDCGGYTEPKPSLDWMEALGRCTTTLYRYSALVSFPCEPPLRSYYPAAYPCLWCTAPRCMSWNCRC